MAEKNPISIKVSAKISELLLNPDSFADEIDEVLRAGGGIVEREYKKQSPVNFGRLRGDTTLVKLHPMEYFVTTTAMNNGRPYPLYLHEGTGSQRGKSDAGYTSGRVRAGKVKRGIGGIRPNKFAKRTKKNTQQKVFDFVFKKIKRISEKQQNIEKL